MRFIFVLSVLGGVLLAAGASGITATPPVSVAPAGLHGFTPSFSPEASLVEQGGFLVTAFTGVKGTQTGIYLRRYDVKQQVWQESAQPVSLIDKRNDSVPSLWKTPDGTLHCVWSSRAGPRLFQVEYSRLRPGDEEWEKPQVLGSGKVIQAASILGDSLGRLYVSYWNKTPNDQWGKIFFFFSHDNGVNWQAAEPGFPLGRKKGQASHPQVVIDGKEEVQLVWLDQTVGGLSVVFNRSADGGLTWLQEPVAISQDRSVAASQPDLFHWGDELYAAWTVRQLTDRGVRYQLWGAKSIDGGVNWSKNSLLHSAMASQASFVMFRSQDDVRCVWIENQEGGGGRMVTMALREGEDGLEGSDIETIHSNPPETYLEELRLDSDGDEHMLLVTERGKFEPAKVLLFLKDKKSPWQMKEMASSQSGQETRGPIALRTSDGSSYFILFHEIRRRRFIQEPEVWESNLLLSQIRFENGSKATR